MSQPKKKVKKVKKVVKKTEKKVVASTKKIKPTVSKTRSRSRGATQQPVEMLFKRQNFLLMGGGVLLIIVGMLLMSGGAMPSPDVWDESLIYSPRRTVLAPLVILAGLGLEIFAIFKRA